MDINILKESLNEIHNEETKSRLIYEANIEYSQISESDQQILQETYFSKDDLQDPETIKKLEDKLKKKEPIFATLGALSGVLTFILSIALATLAGAGTAITLVTLGLPFIAGLAIIVGVYIGTIPNKQFEKDYKKFKNKVEKLRDKSKEKLETEEDNTQKTQYKEIIKNCEKVLKAIEKREKDIADKQFRQQVDQMTGYYKQAIKSIERPEYLGLDYDYSNISMVITIMQVLGVKYNQYLKLCKKADWTKANTFISLNTLYNDYIQSYREDFNELFSKMIPEFNKNEKIAVIYSGDDASTIIYSPRANSFFLLDYWRKASITKLDIFSHFYNIRNIDMDVLKEVDKEEGYYILSDCPPGLIKKKLPI